jgi:hypothetical protein
MIWVERIPMKRHPGPDGPITYQIQVQGRLDEGWSDWFRGLAVVFERTTDGATITTLVGPVADQAALRGVLNRIWDLNLTLLSVTRGDVQ